MNLDKELLLIAIHDRLAEHPEDFKEMVDAATEGVKTFAERQSDTSTRLAYPLMSILHNNKDNKEFMKTLDPFDLKQLCERIEPWFRGTPALKELQERIKENG